MVNWSNIDQGAMNAWNALSQSWGQPLTATSAYRSPEYNAQVGGAKNSQHIHGRAFDVSTAGMSQEQVTALIQNAKAAGFTGVGVYDGSLHFDTGPERAWGPSYSRDSLPSWAGNALAQQPTQQPQQQAPQRNYLRLQPNTLDPQDFMSRRRFG